MRVLNLAANGRAVVHALGLLYRHREIAWELTRQDLSDRHAGQSLKALWIVAHPLLLIAVYLFVFGVVFKVRLNLDGPQGPFDFSVYILSGLIPWLIFAEVLGKSTSVITGNTNLVKQVVFPVEVLPAKTVFAACATGGLLFAFLLLYALIRFQTAPWTWLLLPVVVGVQVLGMLGVAMILSSVGAYVRSLKDVVQMLCLVNVYLMPVVYLPEWVPAPIRPVLYLNPFSYQAWCYQDVLFFGEVVHPWAWPPFVLLNLAALALGYRLFGRLKLTYGNVL